MDLKKEIIDDIEKAQLSAEEILRKYDKESDKRELTLVLHWYFCFTRCASPGRVRK